jgi:hypothetical protein
MTGTDYTLFTHKSVLVIFESPCIFSFIIFTGHGMELTNQFMNYVMNKTEALVIKLLESVLVCIQPSGWTAFIIA